MHRSWLFPKQQQQQPQQRVVQFSLTSTNDDSDSSVSDEALSPPVVDCQTVGSINAMDSQPRRPLTTTTCCAAEVARCSVANNGKACDTDADHPEHNAALDWPADTAAETTDVAELPTLPPQCRQREEVRNSLVYCDNTLARFRPLIRRTRSFPPSNHGGRDSVGDAAATAASSQQALLLLIPLAAVSGAASNEKVDKKAQEFQLTVDGGVDSCCDQQQQVAAAAAAAAAAAVDSNPAAASQHRRRVRFADALGFELTSVRVIHNQEDPPEIPRSVLAALSFNRACAHSNGAHSNGAHSNGVHSSDLPNAAAASYSTCWRPLFQSRTPQGHLERRLPEQKIALEAIRLETMALEATVLVQNLGPIKKVAMRLTDSAWQRHSDLPLDFLESLPSLGADRFQLRTCLPFTAFTARQLQFALRLIVDGCGEYWDNNGGRNYAFLRLEQPQRSVWLKDGRVGQPFV